MQTRRGTGTPVAVLLAHGPAARRPSSLLSVSTQGTPRTPRSCGSPSNSVFVPPPPNRKSTDSWNSSNADELESEWRTDQLLLLSRTLDALPAHLATPFHGPVPPSNLLDKIARGVSHAKGPVDWPHSLRATRVKLIELSRLRAKEQQPDSIAEEPEDMQIEASCPCTQDGGQNPLPVAPGAKRPLYRQSSMDFMLNAQETDKNNNEHLARLSSQLQSTQRQGPYQSSTALISPSTPSSSTLNSLSTLSAQRRNFCRPASVLSSSSLSIISSSSDGILPNPRVQRLMQDDAFVPAPPPKDSSSIGAKRPPFFGALAQEARHAHSSDQHSRQTCPSSDEEERVRNQHKKKARKLSSPLCTSSPAPTIPTFSSITTRKGHSGLSGGARDIKATENKSSKERKENVQLSGKGSNKPSTRLLPKNPHRTPNMVGSESPLSLDTLSSCPPTVSARVPQSPRSPSPSRNAPRVLASAFRSTFGPSPAASISPSKAPLSSHSNDASANPDNLRGKTLRRVRRLAPARRISFGSLTPSGHEADVDGEGDGEERGGRIELGSAFQLH